MKKTKKKIQESTRDPITDVELAFDRGSLPTCFLSIHSHSNRIMQNSRSNCARRRCKTIKKCVVFENTSSLNGQQQSGSAETDSILSLMKLRRGFAKKPLKLYNKILKSLISGVSK